MNAFGSLIHSQAMLELHSRCVSLNAIFPLYYMYRHLKVGLKLGNELSDSELPVFVRIKQGAITSPITTTIRLFLHRLAYLLVAFQKGYGYISFCYVDDLLKPCW